MNSNDPKIIATGKHIRMVERNGWEYVERPNTTGIVVIVAVTRESKLLLVEQYRPPVQSKVIELPAGLAGDQADSEGETLIAAAKRELLEETGYLAQEWGFLTEGPPSAGITTEFITLYKASELTRIDVGGGDDGETIKVHEIPLTEAEDWLRTRQAEGILIDPKVYLGLYFAGAQPQQVEF